MALSRYAENGVFAPAKIAGVLRTTRDEIAQTAGLGRDAMLRKDRIASQKTQKRLREMVEILNKIESRFGSDLIAYAWYRSEPLPGFSGQTAMQLVRAGRAADVLEYIDAVDAGVFCLTPIDRFTGFLYRALNPVYARDPLSGRGAQLYGGRFNPKGTPALYASLSPMTALREANQVGTLQPTTLVAYDADIRPVFDTRDTGSLAGFDMTPRDLASVAWRDEMMTNGESETQKFARRLIAAGYAALLVPSFARGALSTDLNLVLWRWGDAAPTRLVLIDDEKRLSLSLPGGMSIAIAAPTVGYEFETAFGAAFKRVIGHLPQQFAKASAG